MEDKIVEISCQVEQKKKEWENRREKLRILEFQSSSSSIPQTEIPNRENRSLETKQKTKSG